MTFLPIKSWQSGHNQNFTTRWQVHSFIPTYPFRHGCMVLAKPKTLNCALWEDTARSPITAIAFGTKVETILHKTPLMSIMILSVSRLATNSSAVLTQKVDKFDNRACRIRFGNNSSVFIASRRRRRRRHFVEIGFDTRGCTPGSFTHRKIVWYLNFNSMSSSVIRNPQHHYKLLYRASVTLGRADTARGIIKARTLAYRDGWCRLPLLGVLFSCVFFSWRRFRCCARHIKVG